MATRNAISRKVYEYADGSTSRSAKPDAVALRFEVFNGRDKDGKPVVHSSTRVTMKDFSEDVLKCAAWHGLSQKIGDEAAGFESKAEKAGEAASPDFVLSLFQDMIDNLKSGVWVEEGEGGSGANVTILFEAMLAAFDEAKSPLPEEKKPALMKRLQDKAERDKARANPTVLKHVKRIEAERAAARAKAAVEAAKAAKPEDVKASLAALMG